MSAATMANWGANLVIALTFLSLIDHLGPSFTCWIYSLVCIAAFMFFNAFVPETKNRSLEEIQRALRKQESDLQ